MFYKVNLSGFSLQRYQISVRQMAVFILEDGEVSRPDDLNAFS